MKTIQHLLITIILLFSIILSTQAAASFYYNPTDVTPQDNAYKPSDTYTLQWWYLDAVFTNNQSVHIGITTIGARNKPGFYLLQINIYQNGTLIKKAYQWIPKKHVFASETHPELHLRDQVILKGTYNQTGDLTLQLTLKIKKTAVNLTFKSLTKGWMGYTGKGMWGCPLPKANVTGTLTYNDHTIRVHGIGYQEHAWDVQTLHKSWQWAKFTSNTYNVVFSQNMKNRWREDIFLVVVNNGHSNYTSIQRENITLTHRAYTLNHGRLLPKTSILTINQDNIKINVTLQLTSYDFRTLLIMKYWRCHFYVTGTITINDQTEIVNEYQIMDLYYQPIKIR